MKEKVQRNSIRDALFKDSWKNHAHTYTYAHLATEGQRSSNEVAGEPQVNSHMHAQSSVKASANMHVHRTHGQEVCSNFDGIARQLLNFHNITQVQPLAGGIFKSNKRDMKEKKKLRGVMPRNWGCGRTFGGSALLAELLPKQDPACWSPANCGAVFSGKSVTRKL